MCEIKRLMKLGGGEGVILNYLKYTKLYKSNCMYNTYFDSKCVHLFCRNN